MARERKERYSVISIREKDGTIMHTYRGKVNVSAGEPHYEDFSAMDPLARKVTRQHREIMDSTTIKRIVTKITAKR